MAIPGVGSVIEISSMTAIDDPTRFGRSRDVALRADLAARAVGSSIDVQGRILRAGDADVRRARYEAASALMTCFKGRDKGQGLGQEIAKRCCLRQGLCRRSAQTDSEHGPHLERWNVLRR